jgi:hypothetical protein
VDTETDPVDAAVSDHQTVFVLGFELPVTQGGVGSVVSVVARELSTVLVKLVVETTIAFAMLSLMGGPEAFTVKVCAADASPAIATSSVTFTEAVVP